MFQVFRKGRMWERRPLRDRYRVVIIGGGVHGLATAYYLTKLGIKDVAVFDKGYLGGGASARTTAIIRSNYLTTEGIPFFDQSVKLYEGLAKDLNFNILFNQMGRLDLGHTDAAVYALRMRTEFNRILGVDSRMVGPAEIKRLVPSMSLREGLPYPIIGALYHPPCGVVRHDAVVWGFARGADRGGAELHPFTEVTAIERANGCITGVQTDRGPVEAEIVLNATAGWSSEVARLAGVDLPITTHPLQVMVTEPLKPFLDKTISSANLHAYVYQTDRGEVVHRRRRGPVSVLQYALDTAADGATGGAHAGNVSLPGQGQGFAPVGRAVRHDAGLLADNGPGGRVGRLHSFLRLGQLGLQGRARRSQERRQPDCHRSDSRPD